nr:ABC transporter permease subunit [Desulfosediminicola ganghwensis]
MRDIQKILLDLSLSTISLTALVVPFFITITIFSKDIENKTISIFLSRSISRSQYIIGKFSGILMITACIYLILTIFSFTTIGIAQLIYPLSFFENLNIPSIAVACGLSFLSTMTLISCTILWCCLTTSSFLATLLSIATYIIGQSTEDLVRFISLELADGVISPATEVTVKAALYLFPNLSSLDYKYYAAYGMSIPPTQATFSIMYAVSYTFVILLFSVAIFSKKELA